jgi:hypothetical protein
MGSNLDLTIYLNFMLNILLVEPHYEGEFEATCEGES